MVTNKKQARDAIKSKFGIDYLRSTNGGDEQGGVTSGTGGSEGFRRKICLGVAELGSVGWASGL